MKANANSNWQGGRIGNPKTGMGSGPNARFYFAPDRVTILLLESTLKVVFEAQDTIDTDTVSQEQFNSTKAKLEAMANRGMALRGSDNEYYTTTDDLVQYNKIKKQEEEQSNLPKYDQWDTQATKPHHFEVI